MCTCVCLCKHVAAVVTLNSTARQSCHRRVSVLLKAWIFYLPQCLNFKTTTPGVLQGDIGALTTVVHGVSTLVVRSQEGNFPSAHNRECIRHSSLALFLTRS